MGHMKITKHKSGRPGAWLVKVNGRHTDITISKGDAPRWGMKQEWHVYAGDDHIMDCTRASDAIPQIYRLLKSLGIEKS